MELSLELLKHLELALNILELLPILKKLLLQFLVVLSQLADDSVGVAVAGQEVVELSLEIVSLGLDLLLFFLDFGQLLGKVLLGKLMLNGCTNVRHGLRELQNTHFVT